MVLARPPKYFFLEPPLTGRNEFYVFGSCLLPEKFSDCPKDIALPDSARMPVDVSHNISVIVPASD